MTDFQRMHDGQRDDRSDGADPAITELLRSVYAAPVSESYWTGLEQRVKARLQETPLAWWSVFSEWRTAGLVAATLALLLAGAAMVRQQALDPSTVQMANGVAADSTYDAVLRTLIDGDAVTVTSNPRRRLPADAPERYLNPLGW
jgi:anti-sigma-K factor RskA